MKRIGDLWPELVSFDNLYLAYGKARRGKRSHLSVERFEHHRELELARLQAELISGEYRCCRPNTSTATNSFSTNIFSRVATVF